MFRSFLAARVALPAALLLGASSGAAAWWDKCDCGYGWGPPPVYVYVPAAAPTWTSNGWSYPSVGYLVPPPPGPYVIYGYRSGYYGYGGPQPRYRARPLK